MRPSLTDLVTRTSVYGYLDWIVQHIMPDTADAETWRAGPASGACSVTLIHAGRVWTGFSHKLAEELFRRLDEMPIPKARLQRSSRPLDARRVQFVTPELVAEVEFRTWTADGLIRHSSFRGLREDKPPEEVVLEAKEVPGR